MILKKKEPDQTSHLASPACTRCKDFKHECRVSTTSKPVKCQRCVKDKKGCSFKPPPSRATKGKETTSVVRAESPAVIDIDEPTPKPVKTRQVTTYAGTSKATNPSKRIESLQIPRTVSQASSTRTSPIATSSVASSSRSKRSFSSYTELAELAELAPGSVLDESHVASIGRLLRDVKRARMMAAEPAVSFKSLGKIIEHMGPLVIRGGLPSDEAMDLLEDSARDAEMKQFEDDGDA